MQIALPVTGVGQWLQPTRNKKWGNFLRQYNHMIAPQNIFLEIALFLIFGRMLIK